MQRYKWKWNHCCVDNSILYGNLWSRFSLSIAEWLCLSIFFTIGSRLENSSHIHINIYSQSGTNIATVATTMQKWSRYTIPPPPPPSLPLSHQSKGRRRWKKSGIYSYSLLLSIAMKATGMFIRQHHAVRNSHIWIHTIFIWINGLICNNHNKFIVCTVISSSSLCIFFVSFTFAFIFGFAYLHTSLFAFIYDFKPMLLHNAQLEIMLMKKKKKNLGKREGERKQ